MVYTLLPQVVLLSSGLGDDEWHVCLQELKPGAPQRSWVQSQTTFATLAKDEEGHWMPRVIKQKIWVDGTSYELQEIYGIENSSAGRSGESGKQVRAQHLLPWTC